MCAPFGPVGADGFHKESYECVQTEWIHAIEQLGVIRYPKMNEKKEFVDISWLRPRSLSISGEETGRKRERKSSIPDPLPLRKG